jgi:hypothetical protein
MLSYRNYSAIVASLMLLVAFTGCIDDSELESVEKVDEIIDESDNTIDDTNNTVDETNTTEVPESNFTFEVLSEHPFECMNNNVFDKFSNVFGVYVVGTPEASLEYFTHTANILAQFIDNNEDGLPDDSAVLDILVDNNFVVPVWSEDDREDFWDGARGTYCEDNIGMAASMYHDEDEWALGGIEEAGTWDTNLEEVWHVVSVGWYEAYPEFMGVDFDENNEVITSNLTRAMDAARGGQFMSIPDEYPEDAWYAYYDDTCDYHCQAHEYFYWVLMANIGALDPSITNKCEDSKDEWYVCTKSDLETRDVLVYDLFNNQGFNLPKIIPDGSYQATPEVVVIGDTWGQLTTNLPEIYATSDVPQSQIDLVMEGYTTASEAWGNFGPIEFWIVGSEMGPAEELDKEYCSIRIEKDSSLGGDYEEHCLNRSHNLTSYVDDGGAGLNTRRSNYEDYSAFIVTFASKYPGPDETDYTVVAYHEYFHVYQQAHIFIKDHDERDVLMGGNPWWAEGGAEYMAQLLYSRQEGVDSNYLEDRMSWKMEAKNDLEEGESIADISYGPRGYLAYDLGCWFTAFLINQTSEDAYLNGFYDDLNDLGWEGSFVENFGVSSEQMLSDFDEFLELTIEEQLKILP